MEQRESQPNFSYGRSAQAEEGANECSPDPEEAFARYLGTYVSRAQKQGWDRAELADRLLSILDHAAVARPPKGPLGR